MRGTVTDEGVPLIQLTVAGREWPAVIDTGFNGHLELPSRLRESVSAESIGFLESHLAAGRTVLEENYAVQFPFDGQIVEAEATFATGDEILLGTALLRDYRLVIDFPQGSVVVEQALPPSV